MITILNKRNCSGCTACESVCPVKCISMVTDADGFRYPKVDESRCIKCGLCERTCPFINPWDSNTNIEVLAMRSQKEEYVESSSSGAVFYGLGLNCIKHNGYVVGAIFDEEWNVRHFITNDPQKLHLLQGSKYIQSEIQSLFPGIKHILDSGTEVLFSGTPCQVAGLKHYLRREYENLLTVEVVCHGAPSPKAWQAYLHSIEIHPTKVNMRKKNRMSGYSIVIEGMDSHGNSRSICEHLSQNLYLSGFLSNLYLRPSCFACKAKNLKSHADITLGDFWTIEKFSQRWNGTPGLVLVNTPTGQKAIADLQEFEQEHIRVRNISEIGNYIIMNARYTRKNEEFFANIDSEDFSILIARLLKKSLVDRMAEKFYQLKFKLLTYRFR